MPKESNIDVNADYIALYICFLHRHFLQPLRDFPIPLPISLTEQLSTFHSEVRLGIQEGIALDAYFDCFHAVVWSILSLPDAGNPHSLDLFVFATHLCDDSGSLLPIRRLPPDLRKLQWAFRATGVQEVIRLQSLTEDDSLQWAASLA